MFCRTFPVKKLIENQTTDTAYQNLGWMRYFYSMETFRIHLTKTGNAVCFTLRLAIQVSMQALMQYVPLHQIISAFTFHLNAPPFEAESILGPDFSLSTRFENFPWKIVIFPGYYEFHGIYNRTFMNQIRHHSGILCIQPHHRCILKSGD